MKKINLFQSKAISPIFIYPKQVFVLLLFWEIIVFTIHYINNGSQSFLLPSLSAFIALTLITPWIAGYLYQTFLSLKNIVDSLTETNQQEWFSDQKHIIFGINQWSLLLAVLLAIAGVATDYIIWGTWNSIAETITYALHLVFLFAILGNLGWSYWGVLLFASRLRFLKFDLEPFETKKDEFDKLNRSFLGMLGCGIVLYFGAVLAGWLALGSFMLSVPIMKFWIFPLAFMVISFFIAMQFFLHELMRKAKGIRINKVSLLINSHYREWEISNSAVDASAINDLLAWKDKIEKESDFPFDFLTIASVIVTVLLPTINTIRDLFID